MSTNTKLAEPVNASAVLRNVLNTLKRENDKPDGRISDTIWYSAYETLFDYVESSLEALAAHDAEQAAQAAPAGYVDPTALEWLGKAQSQDAYITTSLRKCRSETASLAIYTHPPAAPVAAQAVPAYTEGHCKEKAKPGGCQLHNLQCGYPACDRKTVPAAPEPGCGIWPLIEDYAKAVHDGDDASCAVLRQVILSSLEEVPAPECSTDPRAPHGFDRNASHNEGRYVCECESWSPEPALAQRQPLTDERIDAMAHEEGDYDPRTCSWSFNGDTDCRYNLTNFARAIERAHGIGGATTGEQR